MNVLFINDAYWPSPNALSFCIDYISEYLKESDRAFVLSLKKESLDKDEMMHGDVCVMRVLVPHYTRCVRLHKNYNKSLCHKLIFHLVSRWKTDYAENYRNSLFCKKTFRCALEIIDREKIDAVLTVSSPFSAHLLGEAIKKERPGVRWIVYQLDPFANNRYLRRDKTEKRAAVERRVLGAADRVFQLSCVYRESVRDGVITGDEKNITPLTLPGLNFAKMPDPHAESPFDAGEITGVYTGNIYDQRIKKVASELCGAMDEPTSIHFYGKGTHSISLDRLVGHGFVSNGERDAAIAGCDCLLIEGDAAPNQVPSKIINYVKSGRPILLFTLAENDSLAEYLEPYENSLTLPLETPLGTEALDKARAFIKNARVSRLSADEVKTRMARFSDDNVSKVIYDALSGKGENRN